MVARRNERYTDWHTIAALEAWDIDYWSVQSLRINVS